MKSRRSAIVERLGRHGYYGWPLVFTLGVTTCISYGTSQYLFGLLVAPVRAETGWSNAVLSSSYAGTVLVSGLAGLAVGVALDRFGARALMSAGSLIGAASLFALSAVHEATWFALLWTAGIGLASGLTYYPVSFTVVANWFHRKQPAALALLTFLGAFASPVFYPLSGLLIARYGWREALVVLAMLQLFVAFPLHAALVRRRPEDYALFPDGGDQTNEWAPEEGVDVWTALRAPSFWTITAAIALAFGASTVVLLEHVAFLAGRGFAPAFVALLVGFFGIAYLPGRWLVAHASGRVSIALQLAIAFALEGLGIVVLLQAFSALAIVAYVALFGLAYGATAPLRGALVAERFGRRAYGEIFAAQNAVTTLVAAAAAAGVGGLIDTFGYGGAFEGCIIACALAVAAILLSSGSRLRFERLVQE